MPKRSDFHKVLIIGSGPVVIGQAGEYDYSGTQACRALKKLGYKVVLVNSNPAAVLSDPDTADTTYIEPLDTATVEKIISRERPDALLANFGGRTGLNLCMQLSKEGILSSHDVQIIGIPAAAMECAENRNSFKEIVHNLGIETPDSDIATSLEEAETILERIDFPCAIRPSHAIAGSGGGLVYNLEEFRTVVNRGLSSSLIGQVLVEASVEGWDELELETIRDSKGQKITVCCIENIDGMGIHSGDSLSVTPMVTVSSELQNKLQEFAYTVLDDLDIVGCANFRFAHNSNDGRIAAIGLDPRTSRVSTLASKATGIPVAYTAALLAAGLTLDEIPFGKSGFLLDHTPARKSVAVKFPRWAFEKFTGAEDRLGAQMQAVGEVIGIGASFKEAFQKSIRSLENQRLGPGFVRNFNQKSLSELLGMLWRPTSERIFILYEALRKGADIEELREKTMMKPWFLEKLRELVALEEKIIACKDSAVPDSLVAEAKKDGFADGYLAKLIGISEEQFRRRRIELNIKESFPAVDDGGEAGEPCCYASYILPDSNAAHHGKSIMILGSGPTRIGQGIEFDHSCVQSALAAQELGYEVIMINSNPASVSSDSRFSDRLYISPITVEDILGIYKRETPVGLIAQFGGKNASNICQDLEAAGVSVLGTPPDTLKFPKNRGRFFDLMETLGIPHPESATAHSLEEAKTVAERIGYPVMLRPSRVPAKASIEIAHDQEDLILALEPIAETMSGKPIMINKFLENALEVEADALSDSTDVFIPSIMEHIELTGVHSGDSACVLPPVSIEGKHLETIEKYTQAIATELKVVGLINIQYAISDGRIHALGITPRASRTIPLVSKVCNIPLARLATQIMMGAKLSELQIDRKKIKHFGVKEAVFPFNMFREVDPVLGPEMRSTGEVLGIADSFELAYYKSQEAAQERLPKQGTVLISVSNRDKKGALDVAKDFARMGFKILATEGTRVFLSDNGIDCTGILKISEGRPHIVDAIKNGEIHLIVNSPLGKRGTSDDSYLRKAAIEYKVAYITTMSAAMAAVKGIEAFRRKDPSVVPLQKYQSDR